MISIALHNLTSFTTGSNIFYSATSFAIEGMIRSLIQIDLPELTSLTFESSSFYSTSELVLESNKEQFVIMRFPQIIFNYIQFIFIL